jgi:hypothetical protein
LLAPQVWAILSVISTNSVGITGQMVIKQGDDSLCGGDSGSAALVQPVTARRRKLLQTFPLGTFPAGTSGNVLLGVVHGGDSLCRATNTYTRFDSTK